MAATMVQRSANLCSLARPLRVGSFSSKIGAYSSYISPAASSLQQESDSTTYSDVDERVDVDWDNLGFGLMPTDYMYTMKCAKEGNFEHGLLTRYQNIELSPFAGVINYGQGLLEGTKAYRKENGNLLLFRPDQNAIRMKIGAERLCMPCPSVDQFVDALKQTVIANERWVPPPGKGSLYIRPLLMGSGPVLGLAPAPEYTFLVYAAPVGNYFKSGIAPLDLYVEEEYHRATSGGTGFVKAISNYAQGLKASGRAKSRGFSDVLYLDSVEKKYLEEVTCSNIFIVKGDVISTPATNGTILPGITRKSIIDIARHNGYKVEERVISIDELMNADEVFCTGTAVVVAPVGSVTYQTNRIEFRTGLQALSHQMYSTLLGIQTGVIEDVKGWTVEIQ
ncbi:hypothetical protein K2173_007956 [Erythroxylum novogranatense]|uniref:Branched-chain-amino-acid aminotransferase n=1 Tax=Erythroxylum novogranatense TaxID=1862640 RepID=A0AAV8T6W7_9ROSI|nr:hypothetical protein K2173_007956 [Erythroxylum novogranatense]